MQEGARLRKPEVPHVLAVAYTRCRDAGLAISEEVEAGATAAVAVVGQVLQARVRLGWLVGREAATGPFHGQHMALWGRVRTASLRFTQKSHSLNSGLTPRAPAARM
jgi:hypothetical protein